MRCTGFTLLETLLVMGIISLLVAIALPGIQRIRATADRMQCAVNLNQIGLALHLHHGDYGRLPMPLPENERRPGSSRLNVFQWPFFLLPYLDQRQLYQQSLAALDTDPWALDNPPHIGYATVIKTYVCPTDTRLNSPLLDLDGVPTALWSYVGNRGRLIGDGVLSRIPGVQFSEITDGLAYTIAVGERPPPDTLQSGRWYSRVTPDNSYPRDTETEISLDPIVLPHDRICFRFPIEYGPGRTDRPCDRLHYWSMHPGGANFLFCDNSVRFIPYHAKKVLPALVTRAGGEPVELPD